MTATPYGAYRFLDPKTLAGLDNLELAARTVVDGVMYGVHPSRTRGPGLEFSQYRSYEPGDDPRRLDWKLFGRSDRYFVRESETDTSLTVRLLLDASGSMAHEEDGLTKFDYARLIAGTLAFVAERQNDAIGLVALADDGVVAVPPQRGHRHLHRMLHQLEALSPRGRWPAWREAEYAITEGGGGRGLTVILSDWHEHGDEVLDLARRVTTLRHEVMVLHLLGRRELDLGWHGATAFRDLETGAEVEVDADRAREAYRAGLSARLSTLRHELEDRGVRYSMVAMDQPIDRTLRAFLSHRERWR
jgi:uncharacterized protein (DUF58 family)